MATKLVNTDLDFGNASRITGLLDGAAPQDAATVAQLNAAIEGISWKDSVRVATAANVNLTAPGATVDGITMVAGDRMLVRSQTAAAENGIYIWNGAAAPAVRSADANTANELEQAVVTVEEGTSAATTFRQTALNFVLGTGAVAWASFGSSSPSASESTAGLIEIASQPETDAGTDDQRAVTPSKLAGWSGRARRYGATFGDGSATSFVITHNLNTLDTVVLVKETGGNKREVECEIRETTVNSITLLFNAAPASNSLRAVVIA